MKRVCFVLLLACSASCQTPNNFPLPPIPENGQPIPFGDILQRARLQAGAATEAFYTSNWTDLEAAAVGIDQSARLLKRADDVPDRLKERLAELSVELSKDAEQLRQAAKAQDVTLTSGILQRVNLKVRELRP